MTEDHLRERARRASRDAYDAALAEVPDVAPEPHDRLAEACANLDRAEERALAEEGLAADLDAWPRCSDEGLDELGRMDEDVALVRAVQDGEASGPVSRDDVFRALQPRGDE